MNFELVTSKEICREIREMPCAHEMDSAFESLWPMGDGYLKKICLRPGFDLYIMDCDLVSGTKMQSLAWPTGFGFKFFISGAMRYRNRAVNEEMVMSGGLNRFAFFPVSLGTGHCLSKERLNVVIISMTPSFFFALFQDSPTGVAGLPAHSPEKAFYHIQSNTPVMEAAARAIFNCSYHGSLQKIFLESKALELAAHQLHSLTPSKQDARISTEERERIQTAREILARRMDAPPSFLSLARMVGLPHNRLSEGFKAVYGATPFALLRDIRLEKSRAMLETQTGNVTQIALDVGYSSLSHFAKAFRERYGISPKQYQLGQSGVSCS
jgi:AraC-like DNA-binding protein